MPLVPWDNTSCNMNRRNLPRISLVAVCHLIYFSITANNHHTGLINGSNNKEGPAADPCVDSFGASRREPHECPLDRVALFLPEAGEEAFSIARVQNSEERSD